MDDALGSPVVSVSPRTGGFSAGPAAVLTCASGRRVFVKAVGTSIDPGTLELVRREGRTAALLPASLPVPALVAQVDHVAPDGSAWTALLLEEVAGAAPATPWTVEAARAVLDDVAACTAAATPCPVPGLPPFAAVVGDDLARWALLVDEPPADLTGWEREHLDRLVGVPDRLLDRGGCVGDSLVHTDLRADNLLVTPDGGTVLLDWAWQKDPAAPRTRKLAPGPCSGAGRAPAGPRRGPRRGPGGRPPGRHRRAGRAHRHVGVSMRRPAPPHMPTLRSFQRRFHDAALTWVRQRAAGGHW
ncbi:phosphotransferase [Klenkia terrae]|uniref:phosphotransferase n=1 Tax=Klenkia terrae TaxID=1052259 RepID=UPI00360902FF